MKEGSSLPNSKLNSDIIGTSNIFKWYTEAVYYSLNFLCLLKVHSPLQSLFIALLEQCTTCIFHKNVIIVTKKTTTKHERSKVRALWFQLLALKLPLVVELYKPCVLVMVADNTPWHPLTANDKKKKHRLLSHSQNVSLSELQITTVVWLCSPLLWCLWVDWGLAAVS